jgi:hypothetical protein
MAALKTSARKVGALTILGTLMACSDPAAPEMVTPPPDPDPEFTKVYDLDVEIRYIEVRGSCDEDVLGNSTAGEFQYKIVVSGHGQTRTHESDGYNTVLGQAFQRNKGTNINFTNRTYSWKALSSSADIDVKLHGAEWDGTSKDKRMANRSGSKSVPFKVGTETRRVVIGASGDCQIRLHYDATWTERLVSKS